MKDDFDRYFEQYLQEDANQYTPAEIYQQYKNGKKRVLLSMIDVFWIQTHIEINDKIPEDIKNKAIDEIERRAYKTVWRTKKADNTEWIVIFRDDQKSEWVKYCGEDCDVCKQLAMLSTILTDPQFRNSVQLSELAIIENETKKGGITWSYWRSPRKSKCKNCNHYFIIDEDVKCHHCGESVKLKSLGDIIKTQ